MEKEKGVSSGFIIVTSIIVMGIVGYFYMNEKKFIENSLTITSNIIDIKNEPRKRII